MECDVHYHLMPDGKCTCSPKELECNSCQGESGCPICDPFGKKATPYRPKQVFVDAEVCNACMTGTGEHQASCPSQPIAWMYEDGEGHRGVYLSDTGPMKERAHDHVPLYPGRLIARKNV